MNKPLSFVSLLVLTACSDMSMNAASDVGVTQGGSQDIGVARDIIEQGGIPGHDYFTAEGLFSEHDLPLSGDECEQVLCPRTATSAISPLDDPSDRLLVQLGFGTNIDADFQRRLLNLALAVDISGSMGVEKMEAVQDALSVMLDQLDEGDRLSIVAFDDQAELRLDSMVMDADGREEARHTIHGLDSRGSTNIEAGLHLAFEQVAPHAGQGGIEDRVMLFTDAQPNVGNTGIGSFVGMTDYYAEAGIGTSIFGVGLDLGVDLVDAVSRIRGGNYFYLADVPTIRDIFKHEFDYMVTPVAYDLDVTIQTREGLQFERGYGAPMEGATDKMSFGASTLFLSSKSGGMGAEISALESDRFGLSGELGVMEMSFETPQGDIVEDSLAFSFEGGEQYVSEATQADDLGVYKMSVLVDEFHALQAAADLCLGRIELAEAGERIREAANRIEEVAVDLNDDALNEEARLMRMLIENLPASQCW